MARFKLMMLTDQWSEPRFVSSFFGSVEECDAQAAHEISEDQRVPQYVEDDAGQRVRNYVAMTEDDLKKFLAEQKKAAARAKLSQEAAALGLDPKTELSHTSE